MKFVILYSNKSSTTGKLLLRKFATTARKAFRKRTQKRYAADLVLRWGSTEEFPRLSSRVEINSSEATRNASNKLVMMKKLVEAGIRTPEILFKERGIFDSDFSTLLENYKDDEGKFYVRGANQEIRYTNEIRSSDLYVSKPIFEKRREYRVHVFNGQVLGIYEKVAREENVRICKAHNCDFRSVNPENCRVSREDQEICIRAVNALGLTFGGVDLLRSRDQTCYVSEVNSSPALNTPNIDRYFDKIMEFYNNSISRG